MGAHWREEERRRQAIFAAARQLPRESSGAWYRTVLTIATMGWLVVFIYSIFSLPNEVPIHWSSGSNLPDNWVSKPVALAFQIGAVAISFAIIYLSRLVTAMPSALNTPHKDWWLAAPERIVRYERLLREDLMLMAAAMVALMTVIDTTIAGAARTVDAAISTSTFVTITVGFLLIIAAIIARMVGTGRYRPDPRSAP